MATTSVALPDLNNSLALSSQMITFAVVKETKTETDPTTGVSTSKVTARHTSSSNEIDKLKKDSPDKIAFEQSVTVYKVGSVAGLAELVPDVEEQIAIINRGLMAKFNQKIKTTLTELTDAGELVFAPVEGAFDSKELMQEGTQRRSLSETDKAVKALSGLDPDTLAKVMAMFQAAQNGGNAAAE